MYCWIYDLCSHDSHIKTFDQNVYMLQSINIIKKNSSTVRNLVIYQQTKTRLLTGCPLYTQLCKTCTLDLMCICREKKNGVNKLKDEPVFITCQHALSWTGDSWDV